MDSMTFEEIKKEAEEAITRVMVTALREGQMTVQESKESAQLVLDEWDDINTIDELQFFLEKMATQWLVYENIIEVSKKQVIAQQDVEEIKHVQEKLQKLFSNP